LRYFDLLFLCQGDFFIFSRDAVAKRGLLNDLKFVDVVCVLFRAQRKNGSSESRDTSGLCPVDVRDAQLGQQAAR